MNLAQYLMREQLSPAAFARVIGAASRNTIHRYLKGQRLPSAEMMRRIQAGTNGAVTPESCRQYYELQRARRRNHRLRREVPMRFPWTRKEYEEERMAEAALRAMMEEARESDQCSPPLQAAVDELGESVTVDLKARHFRLHGRPSEARKIVQEANVNRLLRGKEPIKYPGVCPIHDRKPAWDKKVARPEPDDSDK